MSDTNLPARYANSRFGPGNPGRPAKTRNRALDKTRVAILEHVEAHRSHSLEQLRDFSRARFVDTVLRILPRMLASEDPRYTTAEIARMGLIVRGILGLPSPSASVRKERRAPPTSVKSRP